MGSAHSYLSPESALTAVVVAGAVGIGYHQYTNNPRDAAGSAAEPSTVKKTGKKKKTTEVAELPPPPPPPLSAPSISGGIASARVIPGQFDDTPVAPSKAKKPKKKKPKPAAATDPLPSQPSSTHPPTTSIDTDMSWTRVKSRRKAGDGDGHTSMDLTTTSDAGITTSVTTGNSSPVDEDSPDDRRTLAERLVPRPPKTIVDDLLETPNQPSLARVMRIQPRADEKPIPGFSWGDYEDVHVADAGGNDADGEEDGWGVVQSKRPKRDGSTVVVQKAAAPETLTKKQRQNAQKREAQKASRAAAETDRLSVLAKHKRELENIRMAEQSNKGKKATSGGMTPVVNERGKLVWE